MTEELNGSTPQMQQPVPTQTNTGMSHDKKTIITVILLIFFYPIGLILMFVWMKNWPRWAKVVISLPVIIAVIGIILTTMITLFPR